MVFLEGKLCPEGDRRRRGLSGTLRSLHHGIDAQDAANRRIATRDVFALKGIKETWAFERPELHAEFERFALLVFARAHADRKSLALVLEFPPGLPWPEQGLR